ncbi:hypothetical protein H4R33_003357 [Dimargaris cristalligena]|nr:hypothetical protein H4R33_003357 [Dimargaris cristalligena]
MKIQFTLTILSLVVLSTTAAPATQDSPIHSTPNDAPTTPLPVFKRPTEYHLDNAACDTPSMLANLGIQPMADSTAGPFAFTEEPEGSEPNVIDHMPCNSQLPIGNRPVALNTESQKLLEQFMNGYQPFKGIDADFLKMHAWSKSTSAHDAQASGERIAPVSEPSIDLGASKIMAEFVQENPQFKNLKPGYLPKDGPKSLNHHLPEGSIDLGTRFPGNKFQ